MKSYSDNSILKCGDYPRTFSYQSLYKSLSIPFILLLAYTTEVKGQAFTSSSFSPSIVNQDSLIKAKLDSTITNSYFVITYPTIGSTTSWAPQFIEIFEKIKTRNEDIILVLFNNGGFRDKDISTFLRTSLKLSSEDLKRVKLLINDILYTSLNDGKHLVRLQYYFRGRLLYNEAEKWHKSDTKIFIPESVYLGSPVKRKILLRGDELVKERDPVHTLDSNRYLILTDSKNEVIELNRKTGKINILISRQQLQSATDYYCRYITSEDTSACNFAKNNASFVEETMRKTVSIDGITVINSDSLLLFVNIEVFERNTEDFKFTNDEGQKITISKGAPSLNLYSFVIGISPNTNKTTTWYLDELPSSRKYDKYLMPELGVHLAENGFYTTAVGYGTKDENTIRVCKLEFSNNKMSFSDFLAPNNMFNPRLYMYHNKSIFFEMFGQTYFSHGCDDNIYLIGRDKAQTSLTGDGTPPYLKERYKTYFENKISEFINFQVQTISPILSEKYLASIMLYKGKPILEIKNRMLKTVDIIELNNYPELKQYFNNPFRTDIMLNEDAIVFKLIENDEMYMISIPIRDKQTANTK